MNLNKSDYFILGTMYKKKCVNRICSLTKQKLAKKCELSVYKISSTMKMFQNMGLVEEGAREIREKTYYLTEEGIELAEKISKETEKIYDIKIKEMENEGE